jgi:hypothetical protein
MMSKFVLVHSEKGVKEAKERLGELRDLPASSPKRASSFSVSRAGSRMAASKGTRSPRLGARITVGIWSLDAWLGSLSGLIDALNGAQKLFVFYEVQASVPSGLISRSERKVLWLKDALGMNPDDRAKQQIKEAERTIGDNVIANDFYGLADEVRTDLGLDYIVGITSSMVAGNDDEGYFTDHFSTYEGHTILASSYQLHEFSRSSALPFDAFLANLVVSQLLVALNPRLSFHEDRGCLFDYDDARVTLIDKVRTPMIERRCMALIKPSLRDAAQSLVRLLEKLRSDKP